MICEVSATILNVSFFVLFPSIGIKRDRGINVPTVWKYVLSDERFSTKDRAFDDPDKINLVRSKDGMV